MRLLSVIRENIKGTETKIRDIVLFVSLLYLFGYLRLEYSIIKVVEDKYFIPFIFCVVFIIVKCNQIRRLNSKMH